MKLKPADATFAAALETRVGKDVLRPVEPRYLDEPRGHYAGAAGLLALPRTVEDVSAIIKAAAGARVGVIPYGGGTGLVGAQVAPEAAECPSPLILSMERMTAIRGIFPEENVLIAEAGAILADVQAAARDADRLFPLSLAAEGSARIGGNLSTNAGGVNVLRYGTARELCLGLEAVLPDGSIWHGLRRLRKDNTGYDLRDLLCGAEGTLGVITAAALKLSPIPAEIGTAALVVPDPRAALDLLSLARDRLGEMVSTFELIHRQGLEFLSEKLPELRQPFAEQPEWQVLIEIGLARGMDPVAALADLFEEAAERELVSDGIIAQSEAQRMDIWNVRENIPEANRLIGAIASHDIALPLSRVPEFIDRMPQRAAAIADVRINCFGHLGDGNLHYNFFPVPGRTRADYADRKQALTEAVHDLVAEMDGSISAEHGIGRLKVGELERYGDPVKLAAMRAIKAALDPVGIMNPGAVLRA
ncbi:FAD-binding oxidoreductase [Chachezhania sediminis]|uniref:FAD-binding oxidoreductase n=1 Tax=Chachezhania sediminis TaxID=2599291 RepID=UPI00131A62CB|nr:FAD-binding oxidoreductase [Chachezhania sediminis]